MEVFKKCLLYALSFVLFSTSFSTVFSGSVSAVSPYDSVIKPTTELRIKNISIGYNNDISNNIVGTMEEVCDPSYVSGFTDAVSDENGRWAITNTHQTFAGEDFWTVEVGWVIGDIYETNWTESPLSSGEYRATVFANQFVTLFYADLGGGASLQCNEASGETMPIGYTDSDDKYVWVSTYPPNYPPDYEGDDIPDSNAGQLQLKPSFEYSVNLKQVTAKTRGQNLPSYEVDEGWQFRGYSIEWTLFKCNPWVDETKSCTEPEVMNYQVLPVGDQYNYGVNTYDEYKLQAQYVAQECYRYPSYPATPDNCVYVDFDDKLPDYAFTSTSVYLNINGQSIAGDTEDGDCDASGFCEPPSPYEDCSIYGVDIIAGISCAFRNFGVWLTLTLKSLFIPSPAFIDSWVQQFNEFLEQKLGFVWQSITSVVAFFTDILTAAATTECTITTAGEIFDATFTIDVCEYEELSPTTFAIMRSLVIGGTTLMLVFAGVRKYQEVMNRR